MAKERIINTRFWSDNFIREKLNPLDRYLYLYFLTNEKTNIAGIYELPISIISSETGIEEKTILDMLQRLAGRVGYKDGWVVLVNFLKYQHLKSKTVRLGIENSLNDAPKHIIDYAYSIRYAYGIDKAYLPCHILKLKLELESELESESESEKKPSPFVNPENLRSTSVRRKNKKEFLDERRAEQGKPPMERRVATEKQRAAMARLQSLDYFHKVGVRFGLDYLSEEDEQANAKFVGQARVFEKRFGENYKEPIDWWFSEDNAWCDYHPSNFFNIGTYMKFENRKKKNNFDAYPTL